MNNYFMVFKKMVNEGNFSEGLSYETLKDNINLTVVGKRPNGDPKIDSEFHKIKSNTALRKIYDAFNDTKLESENIKLWFARLAYQEARLVEMKNFPIGVFQFFQDIYILLNDSKKFRQFLEVFVAYHQFITKTK